MMKYIQDMSKQSVVFNIIIVIFFIQALWVAVSFRYPMMFDEAYHLGVVQAFSKQWSPVIINQPTSLDQYGNVTFGNASIYHYLLGIVYRLISLCTNSFPTTVVVLRIVNILFVVLGFMLYRRLFREFGVSEKAINIGLFLLTIVPLFVLVSATISYDNMIFPLTAAFLLLGVRILRSKNSFSMPFIVFCLFGMAATLIKFTFLPIAIAGVIYLLVAKKILFSKKTVGLAVSEFRALTNARRSMLILGIAVIGGLFVFRYGVSMVMYHSPIPSCDTVMSRERCRMNGVYQTEVTARATKNSRYAQTVPSYTQNWAETIYMQLDTSGSPDGLHRLQIGKAIPLIMYMLFFGSIIGIISILLWWSRVDHKKEWSFLVTIACVLVSSTFGFNILSYYSANMDINVQARYLLSIVPIFTVLSVLSVSKLIGANRTLKLAIVIVLLVSSTQGGGALKHIVTSEPSWYWDNQQLKDFNAGLQSLAKKLIYEQDPVKEVLD